MRVALPLAAATFIMCLATPLAAQAPAPTGAHQTALDHKFGSAPAGSWWDDTGRLCRTQHQGGKAVRRCEHPDRPSDTNQAALARKYGPAPADHWWDGYGRLCHTEHTGKESTRRCEKPTAHS